MKVRNGETPLPTRETRALPGTSIRHSLARHGNQRYPNADKNRPGYELKREFFTERDSSGAGDDNDAESLERINEAQIVVLEQAQVQKKLGRHQPDTDRERNRAGPSPKTGRGMRRCHGMFQENLARGVGDQGDQYDDESSERHSSSSRRATGFATTARPNDTSAIPIQRRLTMFSP